MASPNASLGLEPWALVSLETGAEEDFGNGKLFGMAPVVPTWEKSLPAIGWEVLLIQRGTSPADDWRDAPT